MPADVRTEIERLVSLIVAEAHPLQMLHGRIRRVAVPFDILVATTEDLEARGHARGLIYRDALREGKEPRAA